MMSPYLDLATDWPRRSDLTAFIALSVYETNKRSEMSGNPERKVTFIGKAIKDENLLVPKT